MVLVNLGRKELLKPAYFGTCTFPKPNKHDAERKWFKLTSDHSFPPPEMVLNVLAAVSHMITPSSRWHFQTITVVQCLRENTRSVFGPLPLKTKSSRLAKFTQESSTFRHWTEAQTARLYREYNVSVKSSTCYEEIVNLSFVKKKWYSCKKKKKHFNFCLLFKEHLYQTRNKSFWFSVVCLLHSFFFFFFFPGHEVAQRLVLQCYDKITGSIPSGKFILIRTSLCVCVCV